MSSKLDCPVCGYKEIEKDICPNCDTDVVLIRMLKELPQLEEPQQKLHSLSKIARQLAVAAIILLIGIGLGTLGSFLFFQPQQIAVITPNNQAVISSPQPSPIPVPAKPKQPTTYTVKLRDNLSLITDLLCPKGTNWQVMVQANPQLKGRENYIDKGEVLKVPNCQEAM